jgi:hypothetical protein
MDIFHKDFLVAAKVAPNASSASFLPHVTFATSSINRALFLNQLPLFMLAICLTHFILSPVP